VLSEFLLNLDVESEKTLQLSKMFSAALSHLSCSLSSELHNAIRDHKTDIWASVYITRDTLLTSTNEAYCFRLIMEKLMNSGFRSAYIYLYDQPVQQFPNGLWQVPDNLLFQACNKDGVISVFHGDDRIIPSSMIFHNKYTNNDSQHTMVVTPIFTNEVQHGLFVCDADIHTFGNIYAAVLQLGTSMKFISLMKQQIAIQSRLESSMSEVNEKNDLLNRLYITDELTQLFNRRGFFEVAQRLVNLKSNIGKTAIITFADMDNLKQVNDKFGHKEGDFALKQIANTLRRSFTDNAIIARIGGDEFVVFSLIDSSSVKTKITGALAEYTNEVNATCGKPYYIDISYGITEFVCSEDLNIEDILIQADEILYDNKKHKRKSVLK
jgi:diguanylate cyclase (GGDEF)-like protein